MREQPVLTILGSGGLPPPRTRLGFGRRCSPARTRDLAAELVPWSQSDTRRLAGAARSELALLLAPGTLFGDPLIVLGPSSTHAPHWFGSDGQVPAEVLSELGRQGERMHVRAQLKNRKQSASEK